MLLPLPVRAGEISDLEIPCLRTGIKKTPWPESASELKVNGATAACRQSKFQLLLIEWCRVVTVEDPIRP
jgi:hypothetical protein